MRKSITSHFHSALFVLGCALSTVGLSKAADVPLQTIAPSGQVLLNPCFSVSSTSIQTPDQTKHSAIRMVCGGMASWQIPSGAASFKVTLWRGGTLTASSQPANDVNPVRLRFYIDGRTVLDTAVRISMPPDVWTVPVAGGKVLSVRLDQETGTDAIFMLDAAFSPQAVSSSNHYHILASGTAYADIGNNPRQIAFYDYYAGEIVPIQAEYAANASRADVSIKIKPLFGNQPFATSLAIPLHSYAGMSIGSSQWKVPSFYGPCALQLQMTVNGRVVYSKSVNIAISKQTDLSQIKNSNFGVHVSSNGFPLLQDDFANLWGAKWARIFIRWDRIEAQQGNYNWTNIDSLMSSYLQQHFLILGVMGELPPKWASPSQLPSEYQKFVEAALEHFRGKITYWDVYNEVDSKYFDGLGFDRNADPQGDVKVLRQEMQFMHQFDPSLVKVCCSPGGTEWLQYSKRLFDAGLTHLIDIVSMHPYQAGPPEYSDNGMTYVEMVQRLENLASSYGARKPVWSTEANWLIGPAGTPGVTAPDVNEHQQSQYVVRVNLLSLGMHVPYFVHSPFFTGFHREVLVDSLSSYAAMTSILSDAQDAKLLQLPEGIYGISASTKSGTVLALWSTRSAAVTVHVSGLRNATMQDMYGNPLSYTADPTLTGSPIYITGSGVPAVSASVSASMRAMAAAPAAQAVPLPPPQNWAKGQKTQVQNGPNGVHVFAAGVKYDNQMVSPVFPVSPNSCYVIRAELTIHQGGVGIVVSDPDIHKNLRADYLYAYTGNDKYAPAIRIQTQNHTHLQLIFQAGNAHDPANTEFDLTGVQISQCK